MQGPLTLSFLALIACALPASAIMITVNEQSTTRLDFNLVWGSVQDLNRALAVTPGVFSVDATESSSPAGVNVFAESNDPRVQDGFQILFSSSADRQWSSATLASSPAFDGVQALAIPGEDFGARFVYGQPLANSVPAGGSSGAFLAGALGALAFLRRTVRP